jgi:hypothetical protein
VLLESLVRQQATVAVAVAVHRRQPQVQMAQMGSNLLSLVLQHIVQAVAVQV